MVPFSMTRAENIPAGYVPGRQIVRTAVLAVVVLGARSNAGRFMETQNLFNWMSAKATTIFATKTPVAPQQQ